MCQARRLINVEFMMYDVELIKNWRAGLDTSCLQSWSLAVLDCSRLACRVWSWLSFATVSLKR
jgi:hypothetical protein